jgi:hypothetical protein
MEFGTDVAIPQELRPCLSAAARQAHQSGEALTLTKTNWRALAELHASVRVSEKVDKLLRFVAEKCERPGVVIRISGDDCPIADCKDMSELYQYVEYLIERKLLKGYPDEQSDSVTAYAPTIEGWQTIEPSLSPGGIPGRCFVAISFDEELNEAYLVGLKPAIEIDCRFKCVCLRDGVPKPSGITDRILSEIRLAQFVVADFTGQKQSVYFEAGFAKGLGRKVIWTCREDERDKLHFDTKHLGHVFWRTPDDLRVKLAESIRANIIEPA